MYFSPRWEQNKGMRRGKLRTVISTRTNSRLPPSPSLPEKQTCRLRVQLLKAGNFSSFPFLLGDQPDDISASKPNEKLFRLLGSSSVHVNRA